jgi:hypothetical protein
MDAVGHLRVAHRSAPAGTATSSGPQSVTIARHAQPGMRGTEPRTGTRVRRSNAAVRRQGDALRRIAASTPCHARHRQVRTGSPPYLSATVGRRATGDPRRPLAGPENRTRQRDEQRPEADRCSSGSRCGGPGNPGSHIGDRNTLPPPGVVRLHSAQHKYSTAAHIPLAEYARLVGGSSSGAARTAQEPRKWRPGDGPAGMPPAEAAMDHDQAIEGSVRCATIGSSP